jgi:hypothetical protein
MFVFANLAPKSVMNIRSVDKSDISNISLCKTLVSLPVLHFSRPPTFSFRQLSVAPRGAPERVGERAGDEKQRELLLLMRSVV